MTFDEWLTDKYVQWRGKSVGNEKSISEFARLIGIKQSLMSQWMKPGGKVPRDPQKITALVNFFGPEVYKYLGLPKTKELQMWEWVSSRSLEDLIYLERVIENWRREIEDRGIPIASPESERILQEIAERESGSSEKL